MCRTMTVGRKFLPLFLFLFFEAASLSAGESVQAPQSREGDVWRFHVSHKDWINWSSDAIQSGDYEVRYTQGELKLSGFPIVPRRKLAASESAPFFAC
jgi:hypothetical protein